MSRALAVSLSLLVPLGAAAQPAAAPRKLVTALNPPVSDDVLAFQQAFDIIVVQSGQSYLRDQPMPDPATLAPLMANIKGKVDDKKSDLGKAEAKRQWLEEVIGRAQQVQKGAGSDPPEVYRLKVDQVADDLGVGEIVAKDFESKLPALRPPDWLKKSTECHAQAGPQAGFYMRCLGKLKAEEVYLNPDRAASGQGQNPAARSRLSSDVSAHIDQNLNSTKDKLLAGLPTADNSGPSGSSPAPTAPAQGQSAASRSTGAGPIALPQPPGFKTNEPPPLDSVDLAAGAKVGVVAVRATGGSTTFRERCYSTVKVVLNQTGIIHDNDYIYRQYEQDRAVQFNDYVKAHPDMIKRKLLRIKKPSWPLPIGTLVIWSPSACGYSDSAGHIEIVTRIRPPQSCSDACGNFQTACLNTYGADPELATQELPQAQTDLAAAQAAADAATGYAARSKAAAVVAKKKGALTEIQARITFAPRVAVYAIEKQ